MSSIETPKLVRPGAGLAAGELRNLLIGAAIVIAAGCVPLVFDGYALQLAISIVMYTAPCHLVAFVLGTDQLHRAFDGGVLRHRHVYGGGGHRSRALSGADPRRRRRRRRVGGGRGPRYAAGIRSLFRYLLAWPRRTGAPDHDLGAARSGYHERPLRNGRTHRSRILLAALVAGRGGFRGRVVDRPLAARLCPAHHR